MNIAMPFLGPPGSGKSTQAKLLCKKYNAYHLVIGDLVRKIVNNPKDEFGNMVKERYVKGIPQPDNTINELVKRGLKKIDFKKFKIIVLDPYPISIGQLKALEDIKKEFNFEKILAIYIKVSEQEAVKRLTIRRICPKCKALFYPLTSGYNQGICLKCNEKLVQRKDDTKEVATKRYKIYKERIKPIVDFYKKRNELIEVNGEQSVEEVHQELIKKLNLIKI